MHLHRNDINPTCDPLRLRGKAVILIKVIRLYIPALPLGEENHAAELFRGITIITVITLLRSILVHRGRRNSEFLASETFEEGGAMVS